MAFLAVSIQYVCARDFNVADFGADGKSETIADAQIQKAIDECSKSGEEKCASATGFTTAIAYG